MAGQPRRHAHVDGRRVQPFDPDTIIPNPARLRLDRAIRIARAQEGDARPRLARLDTGDAKRVAVQKDLDAAARTGSLSPRTRRCVERREFRVDAPHLPPRAIERGLITQQSVRDLEEFNLRAAAHEEVRVRESAQQFDALRKPGCRRSRDCSEPESGSRSKHEAASCFPCPAQRRRRDP